MATQEARETLKQYKARRNTAQFMKNEQVEE